MAYSSPMGVDSFTNAIGARKREAKRARVLLTARIDAPSGEITVRLRNLSRKGALVEGEGIPSKGEKLAFIRGNARVPARVVWVAGNQAGLEFRHPIDESELLVQVTRAGGQPDRRRYRRPRLTSDDITPEERMLIKLWGMSVDIDMG